MSNLVFKHWRRGCLVAFTTLAALAFPIAARAATVTGIGGVIASEYANPFDPDGDGVTSGSEATIITSGAIGGGTVVGSTLDRVVSREDSRGNAGTGFGRLESVDGSASMGFMQFTAANPFTVGTVVTAHNAANSLDAATPFEILLGGQTVETGLGTVNTHPYTVTALTPENAAVSQLRIEGEMQTLGATLTRFEMHEVVLLPDRLEPIAVSTITGTIPGSTFGSIPAIHDFDGSHNAAGTVGGWAKFGTVPTARDERFLQLDFDGTQTVNGLLVSNWENIPVDAVILDDTLTDITSFTMSSDGSLGEFLAINFETPIATSFLRVEFNGGTASFGVREIIPLTLLPPPPVPEPSTGLLLGLGLLGLTKVRRRRRT